WFRMDQRIAIDDFSDDPAWRARCTPAERWRSTNHLLGPGYWAWLIPLASGAHSVGIVADAAMHPLEGMRDFERAMAWLHVRQPVLAQALEPHRNALMDFRFLRNYSYSCKQIFSADRWAMTGEAGSFLDPFYSPGSDFISINNTYITALIRHDRGGQALAPYAHFYQKLFFSFYDNTLNLFRDQYPLFGNAEVLSIKVVWDYAYYWGVLCQLVFQHRLTDLNLLGAVREDLERAQALNARMQPLFRQWHAASAGRNPAVFLDQCQLDWFMTINHGLHDKLDDSGLIARIADHVEQLEALADTITLRAALADPGLRAPTSGRPLKPLFAVAD
ncbi:MAG: halogenase, partial [Xanthomonadales bacterium]|nr:halogenase [Xanthomonadales bacterium]